MIRTHTGLTFLVAFVLVTGSLFAAEIDDFKPEEFKGSEGRSLLYRIHTPTDLDPSQKYPLVLTLHGAGERGNDNVDQVAGKHGPCQILDYASAEGIKVFIVAPQVPEDEKWVNVPWGDTSHTMPEKPSDSIALTVELLKDLLKNNPVDPGRVYVTGYSMGGFGVWDIVQRNPELFAAAIPVCGGGDTNMAAAIKDVPFKVFHSDNDMVVPVSRSRDMVKALKEASGNPLYTEYPGKGHGAWLSAYTDNDTWRWMFSQGSKSTVQASAPAAPAATSKPEEPAAKVSKPKETPKPEEAAAAAPKAGAAEGYATIISASGDGWKHETVYDGDLTTSYSCSTQGSELLMVLEEECRIGSIEIYYANGDRVYTFEVQASSDGQKYTTVLADAESTPDPTDWETFSLTPVSAKYVKYIAYGATTNDWHYIAEIKIGLAPKEE